MTASAAPLSLFGSVGRDRAVPVMMAAAILGILVLSILLPVYALLSQSLEGADGGFVGLANFSAYLGDPALRQTIVNSLFVAVLTTSITIPLAFIFAYALTRSQMPLKGLFRGAALIPILAPSLISAIALIYIFGNKGFARNLLAGHSIYGPIGIVAAQVLYTFPFATLILSTALSTSDRRLYEVAEVFGTSGWRTFWTITFPSARYGLVSAAFVVFTVAIVDFGIVKVIGGQFPVLASDVYKQIIGQHNFQMGAVVGVILLIPAIVSFVVERYVGRLSAAQLSSRSVLFVPKRRAAIDTALFVFCALVSFAIVFVTGVAIVASFVAFWPYNMSLSLNNYNFDAISSSGWGAYWNSLRLAVLVSAFGTMLTFLGAYLVEKARLPAALRTSIRMIALVPVAVPGIALGLGYIFFLNSPANPLNFLYGTMGALVFCTIAHFYTVPHLTASGALKQLDSEFEAASEALGAPPWAVLWRVTIPVTLAPILDIATFFFVNAMTTVAAVIFLYAPGQQPAAVAIIEMDDTGDTASACAMAVLILATSALAKLVQVAIVRLLLSRRANWRQPAA